MLKPDKLSELMHFRLPDMSFRPLDQNHKFLIQNLIGDISFLPGIDVLSGTLRVSARFKIG